jgi:hypothetical protein
MVFAAIANCPVFGGKLKALDASAASMLPGFVGAHPVRAASPWRRIRPGARARRLPLSPSIGTSAPTSIRSKSRLCCPMSC